MNTDASAVIFTIPGEARAWARAGVRVVTPRNGKPFAAHYMDHKTRAYEAAAKVPAIKAMAGRAPFDCAVVVGMLIRRQPPKSVSKAKRLAMLAGQIVPTSKPDNTNVAKGIEDALNGIVYVDDCMVADIRIAKIYAEEAGVDVIVRPWVFGEGQ